MIYWEIFMGLLKTTILSLNTGFEEGLIWLTIGSKFWLYRGLYCYTTQLYRDYVYEVNRRIHITYPTQYDGNVTRVLFTWWFVQLHKFGFVLEGLMFDVFFYPGIHHHVGTIVVNFREVADAKCSIANFPRPEMTWSDITDVFSG